MALQMIEGHEAIKVDNVVDHGRLVLARGEDARGHFATPKSNTLRTAGIAAFH